MVGHVGKQHRVPKLCAGSQRRKHHADAKNDSFHIYSCNSLQFSAKLRKMQETQKNFAEFFVPLQPEHKLFG
jgi:hypothetical protein